MGHVVYELLEPREPNTGLSALPAPSPGDVFLDLEGDPFAFQTGLEYLMGIVTSPEHADGEPSYQTLWSFDRVGEKEAFDLPPSRTKCDPDTRAESCRLAFRRPHGTGERRGWS